MLAKYLSILLMHVVSQSVSQSVSDATLNDRLDRSRWFFDMLFASVQNLRVKLLRKIERLFSELIEKNRSIVAVIIRQRRASFPCVRVRSSVRRSSLLPWTVRVRIVRVLLFRIRACNDVFRYLLRQSRSNFNHCLVRSFQTCCYLETNIPLIIPHVLFKW